MIIKKKAKFVVLAVAIVATLLIGNIFQAYAAQGQKGEPTLVVFVNVINDDGGAMTASDFALAVTAKTPSPAIFTGSETGTTVTLKNSDYNVTELAIKGYKVSYSPGCSGRINNNEAKTCVVTNDDIAPHLKMIKHVINDNGSSATASDFWIYIYGNNPSPSSFSGSETGTDIKIGPGYYYVNENWNQEYNPNYSTDCYGEINLGDNKTCTITNNDKPKAQLTVIKHVINDDGGIANASDFSIYIYSNYNEPTSFQGSETGTNVTLVEGYYSVSESYNGSDYFQSYSTDCNGYIQPGEIRTCTITNDDKGKAQLIVKKQVVGGTSVPSDFLIYVSADNPSPWAFYGSEIGTNVTLYEGYYSVYENWNEYYTPSYSDCSGEISKGETRTCTIINTFNQ